MARYNLVLVGALLGFLIGAACATEFVDTSSYEVQDAARSYLTKLNNAAFEAHGLEGKTLKLQTVTKAERNGDKFALTLAVSDNYNRPETLEVVVDARAVESVEAEGDSSLGQAAAEFYVNTINKASRMLVDDESLAVVFTLKGVEGVRVEGDEVHAVVLVSGNDGVDRRLGLVVNTGKDGMEIVEGDELEEPALETEATPMQTLSAPVAPTSTVEKVVAAYVAKLNAGMKAMDASAPELTLVGIENYRQKDGMHSATVVVSGARGETRRIAVDAAIVDGQLEVVNMDAEEAAAPAHASIVEDESTVMALGADEADVQEAAQFYIDSVNKAAGMMSSEDFQLTLDSVVKATGEQKDGFHYNIELVAAGSDGLKRNMKVTVVKTIHGEISIEDMEELAVAEPEQAASPSTAHKGGRKPVDMNDQAFVAALSFYTDALEASANAKVGVVSVMHAERQIVSGVKYFASVVVTVGQEIQTHHVEILAKSGHYTVLKDDVGEVHNALELVGEAPIAASAHKGGRKPVDMNDQAFVAALSFYTDALEASANAKVGVVSVMHAERQIVSGVKYFASVVVTVGQEIQTHHVEILAKSGHYTVLMDDVGEVHNALELIGAPEEEKAQVTAMLAAGDVDRSNGHAGFNGMTLAGVVAGIVGVGVVVGGFVVFAARNRASQEPVFDPSLTESLV